MIKPTKEFYDFFKWIFDKVEFVLIFILVILTAAIVGILFIPSLGHSLKLMDKVFDLLISLDKNTDKEMIKNG